MSWQEIWDMRGTGVEHCDVDDIFQRIHTDILAVPASQYGTDLMREYMVNMMAETTCENGTAGDRNSA